MFLGFLVLVGVCTPLCVIQGHFIARMGSEGPLYRDKVVEILIIQTSMVSVKVCHALRAAERHKHEKRNKPTL